MNRIACRADFFDASALVKIYSDEPCSDVVRPYFRERATKYTSPFCFYEALNALKGKWKYQGKMSNAQYLDAAFQLTAWYSAATRRIDDLDFTDPMTFSDAKRLANSSQLDLSDAFQILSVKKGYFSPLANESATVLVTADSDLAVAARSEGLRVWNLMSEPAPK
jgi:predicted nucleic acid-binding protein